MVSETKVTHEIVRTYFDPNAPTGEGKVWVTADGRHWQQVLYRPTHIGTGDRIGKVRNGRMIETT